MFQECEISCRSARGPLLDSLSSFGRNSSLYSASLDCFARFCEIPPRERSQNRDETRTFVSLTLLDASNYSFDDRLLCLTVARVVLNTQRCVVERYNLLSYTTMKEVLAYVKHFLLRERNGTHIVIRSNMSLLTKTVFSFKENERCIVI